MTPLERWTDDRLDDLAAKVEQAMKIQDKLSDLEIQFLTVRVQNETCLDEVRHIRQAQDAERTHREEREDEMRKERKSDRKWAATTILAVLVLVITALGIFLG